MSSLSDLSGKSTEELIRIRDELREKKQQIHQERDEIYKALRLYWNQMDDVCKEFGRIAKEIERREAIVEAKHMICEYITSIEGIDLLSDEEISIITAKIDKTDYRKHGSYPRFIDLERICKEVIHIKKRYPTWTLTNVSRGAGELGIFPPHIFYKYEYKENECYFSVCETRRT